MANVTIDGLTALSGDAALTDKLAIYDVSASSPKTRGATVQQVHNALKDPDFTTLKVGTGAAVSKILKADVSISLSSLAADSEDTQTATITGAVAGDHVVLTPDGAPTAGLTFQAWISAADTISIKARNHTGSPITSTEDFKALVVRA